MERKTLDDFNSNLAKNFNFLAISRHSKVIGTGSLKHILYASDYDLNDTMKVHGKNITDHLVKVFQTKFKIAEKTPNMFIPDFKCGEYNNEPLRWDKHDVAKGYKIVDKNKIYMKDCLLQKAVLKLDLTVLIDGVFTDLSEFYTLNINGIYNYDKNAILKENRIIQLKGEVKGYVNDKNYFKSLKRVFSLQRQNNNPDPELIDFLNGQIGFLNKSKNALDILDILLVQKFKIPKIVDVKNHLQIIKQDLSNSAINFDKNTSTIIDTLCEKSSLKTIHDGIVILAKYLNEYIQKYTFKFISNSKYNEILKKKQTAKFDNLYNIDYDSVKSVHIKDDPMHKSLFMNYSSFFKKANITARHQSATHSLQKSRTSSRKSSRKSSRTSSRTSSKKSSKKGSRTSSKKSSMTDSQNSSINS